MCAKKTTTRQLTLSVFTVVILCFCLCVTTFALLQVSVEVKENTFVTGDVALNLNDGAAVINSDDPNEDFRLFEPGMTVVKDFFVENMSTDSVYYRFYLDNVTGYLADIIEITIKDGDRVICSGTANSLNRHDVPSAGILALGERKDLTITFHYPDQYGNETAGASLTFDFYAEAVQTRHNDPAAPFSNT